MPPISGEPASRVKFCKGKRSAVYWSEAETLVKKRGKTPKDQPFLSYFRYNIYEGPDFHELKQSFALMEESS